jgi:outer membrane protein assembly factor BamA
MRKSLVRPLYSLLFFLHLSSLVFSQEHLTVSSIIVSGNIRTKTDIILREVSFKEGDSLSVLNFEKVVERSKQNVINTNLFLSVDFLKEIEGQKFSLTIVVKERLYLIALPVLYLADRNINEWWYDRGRDLTRITFGINGKHFNLTGNNDQLKFKAFGGFIPYFELAYSKPYIDKRKRLGISVGAFYSTQRTMPYRTWNDKLDFFATENRMRERKGAFFELRLRNALYHFHSVYLGYTHTKIADTIAILNPNYFGVNQTSQKIFSLFYDYRFDKRDNRQYPLKGDFIYGQMVNLIINGKNVTNQLSVSILYAKYLSLGRRFYLESSVRTKISTPKKQFYPLINGLGFGNNLVRGFDLYVIDGQHTFLSKNSFKYQAFKKVFNLSNIVKFKQFNTLPIAVYPSIYFDYGFVKNYFPEFSNSKLGNISLKGGGIGLDIVTFYDTSVKMNYSINQLSEKRFFFGIYRDL